MQQEVQPMFRTFRYYYVDDLSKLAATITEVARRMTFVGTIVENTNLHHTTPDGRTVAKTYEEDTAWIEKVEQASGFTCEPVDPTPGEALTEAQAIRTAQRKWGSLAMAKREHGEFRVGVEGPPAPAVRPGQPIPIASDRHTWPMGRSKVSWEDAFVDAERWIAANGLP
jgi:hypothetical protein